MTIKIELILPIRVVPIFSNVQIGQYFVTDNQLWLKTHPFVAADKVPGNAIRLSDAAYNFFKPDQEIRICEDITIREGCANDND